MVLSAASEDQRDEWVGKLRSALLVDASEERGGENSNLFVAYMQADGLQLICNEEVTGTMSLMFLTFFSLW